MSFRFWVQTVKGEAVRISVAAGEEVIVKGGGPTDEGYYWRESRYSLDGDCLVEEYATESRDCDGCYSAHGTCRVRVDELSQYPERYYGSHPRLWAIEQAARPVAFPYWGNVEAHQRDHAAEAAGY